MWKKFLKLHAYVLGGIFGLLLSSMVLADTTTGGNSSGNNIGGLAKNVTNTFGNIGSLAIAVAYLAGIAFAIAAIFKFKQHKDNPQQIPLGVPVTLLAVGVTLVFLPALFKPAGSTLLGDSTQTAGGFKGEGALEIGKQP